jgi:hypothetical protein
VQVTKLASGGDLITFSPAELDEMQGRIAKDAGMTLEAYRAMLKDHMEQDWCQCGDKSEPGAYCPDGRTRNQHCVTKHHWHCNVCDKLTQVG